MRKRQDISERIYGRLLRLYPAAFRSRYAEQMRQAFRDACQAAYRQSGAFGVVLVWSATFGDLVKTALEERVRQGGHGMSRSTLTSIAGPLTFVVGALWLLTALGDLAFQTGLIHDEPLLGLTLLPFLLSFLPMPLALLGTNWRFQTAVSRLGRLGLTASTIGCVGVVVTVSSSLLTASGEPGASQPTIFGYTAFAFFSCIRLGYVLFGIDSLRYRPLAHGNGLPLLLGLSAALSLPYGWFGMPAIIQSISMPPFWHFSIAGACWAWLGVALTGRRQSPQPSAAT